MAANDGLVVHRLGDLTERLRRRCRQEGRRVLHSARRREAPGQAARSQRGLAHLRLHLRVGRHADRMAAEARM